MGMRTRDLKPGFFRNQELAKLPPITRILYQGLWCRADREGRQDGIVPLIKSDIFPLENVPIEKNLKLLEDAGFIVRYEIEGRPYIWCPTFRKNQHPHPKEPASALPPHPEDSGKGNDPITAEPLPDHGEAVELPGNVTDFPGNAVASQPHTLTSSPSIPSNTLATQPSIPPDALPKRMPFTDAQITELWNEYPGENVGGRWLDFVRWIEGGGGKRPRDLMAGFKGFLNHGAKKGSAAAAIARGGSNDRAGRNHG